MSGHYTDTWEETDSGFWSAICSCGVDLGFFPDSEVAADALMDHAYQQGLNDSRRRAEPEAKPSQSPCSCGHSRIEHDRFGKCYRCECGAGATEPKEQT